MGASEAPHLSTDLGQVTYIVLDIGVKQYMVNPLIFRYGFLNSIRPASSPDQQAPVYRIQLPSIELGPVLNPDRTPIDTVQLFERLLDMLQTTFVLSEQRRKKLDPKTAAAFFRACKLTAVTHELQAMSTPDLASFAVLASLVRAERIKRECDTILTTRCWRQRMLGYDLWVFAKRHHLVELCSASISQLVVQYGAEAESRFGLSMDDLKLAFTPTFSHDPVLALYHMVLVDAQLDVSAEELFRRVHDHDDIVQIKSVERMRHLREWMLDASFITGGVLKFALELVRHLRISPGLERDERAQAEYTLQLLKVKINEYRYRRRRS